MKPWAAAAESGSAVLDQREVKCRKHHECCQCGSNIERNEHAMRTVIIEGHSVRTEYVCVRHPYHRSLSHVA